MSKAEELKLLDSLAKKTVYFVSDKGKEFRFKEWEEMRVHLLEKNMESTHNMLIDFSKVALEAVSLARKEAEKTYHKDIAHLTRKLKEALQKDVIWRETKLKEAKVRVRKECEAKRLPINWRSNKEVIELVRSEKKKTAEKIFDYLEKYWKFNLYKRNWLGLKGKKDLEEYYLMITKEPYEDYKKRFLPEVKKK